MNLVSCYIEIQKNSNNKYEFDKTLNKLVLDRVLASPYSYPFAYGFIRNTLGNDGDEIDILIITNKELEIDNYVNGYIIGGLSMEDEKGMDEKLFIVLPDEYSELSNISFMNKKDLENIHDFFSNYKSKDENKWSKVHRFLSKSESIELYNKCKIK